MSQTLSAVVLCAGKGTRMKSDGAKVLHPILGRPMCFYPLSQAFSLKAAKVVAVVGHQADAVKQQVAPLFSGQALTFALQAQQRGTADAVAAAEQELSGEQGAVLILYGDVPLITAQTLERLWASYRDNRGVLAMVSCRPVSPFGYGRLLRDGSNKVQRVVEEKDATDEQRKITEVNAGIYIASAKFLWPTLKKLSPKNAQGELYLTDIVEHAAAMGDVAVIEAEAGEVEGVNDRAELSVRAKVMQRRINTRHMRAGVTLLDPDSTFIDDDVTIGVDAVVGPQVSIHRGSTIGARVQLGQGSVVTRSTIADGTEVKPYSVFEEAVVGAGCIIGPFSRLRPGTVLEEAVHVGNFVETKKARLKKGAKANHLAYLGDAEVGEKTNIGAGTITCNYDGVNKHVTTIGANAFIGSDTQLVAPVKVGDGAFVAAGSTITEDVPQGALGMSRTKQVNKEGWAERRMKVLSAKRSE